jgi:hypothetical protein
MKTIEMMLRSHPRTEDQRYIEEYTDALNALATCATT